MSPATLSPPPPTAVETATETDAGRVLLRGTTWADYERLLEINGDGAVRLTYDRGRLEIEMPSKPHERLKGIARSFIETYAAHRGVTFEPAGSTTWRREDLDGGLEADESYYFAHARRMAAVDEVDLTRDPPPELAVEVDLSPPRVEKQSVYARLGVGEIWRWRDGRLTVLLRGDDGRYAPSPRSRCLPDFPLDRLAAAFADPTRRPASELTEEFRRSLAG